MPWKVWMTDPWSDEIWSERDANEMIVNFFNWVPNGLIKSIQMNPITWHENGLPRSYQLFIYYVELGD